MIEQALLLLNTVKLPPKRTILFLFSFQLVIMNFLLLWVLKESNSFCICDHKKWFCYWDNANLKEMSSEIPPSDSAFLKRLERLVKILG